MKRAFTLIELITIIVIIAVAAGILVPSYSRYWNHTRFNGVVRDIRDVFAEAHDRAINKDTTTTVLFDPNNQLFDLQVTPPLPSTETPVALQQEAGSNLDPGEHRGYALRGDFAVRSFRPLTQPGQGVPAGSTGGITFHNDGTSDGAEIVVSSSFGYNARILVLPSTGQITVEEF